MNEETEIQETWPLIGWDQTHLTKESAYPLTDYYPLPLAKSRQRMDLRAIWTGEKRPPKRGEWYLSGATIHAYRAPNDLTQIFPIARIVRIRIVTTYKIEEVLS